jgi:dTDP-4-dehydrorhamnose 3,5-epimerase
VLATASIESIQVEIAPDCLPLNEKGIGSVVLSPVSEQLISGVRIHSNPVFPDDRGYFMEVARLGKELVSGFDLRSTQVSAAVSYPGTIKAFHFHKHQHDCWMPVAGMFQVALVDLRPDSPTAGRRNTLYVGELRPWQILIPPGVGHGYKVVGEKPGTLVYLTDRFYNPSDEGRLPYDDKRVNYDWEVQHR